ncbi:MAG: hypothetical protein HZC54_13335 [Verrucomicrobia bacterium]|nr:hypothetical protein [Verrucomicrobiota bacterium]
MNTNKSRTRVLFVNDHPASEDAAESSVVEPGALERVFLSAALIFAIFFLVAVAVFGAPASWGAR